MTIAEPELDAEITRLRAWAATLERERDAARSEQAATAAVLQAISRSAFDLPTVLDTVVENATQLLGRGFSMLLRREGHLLKLAALHIVDDAERAECVVQTAQQVYTAGLPLDHPFELHAVVVREQRPRAFISRPADPRLERVARETRAMIERFGVLATLAVPLLAGDTVIGTLEISRHEDHRFTDQEIALLQTFADQAVIAIENARLFEAIEQKTRELEVVNRQLVLASTHKSAFVSNMSHELRTPLHAIIGFADLLSAELGATLTDRQREYLAALQTSADHLLAQISGILDLAKIEAGKMDLVIEPFDVAFLVQASVAVARPLVERNGTALVVHCSDDVGTMAADEMKVRQCLLNLLSNAAKFTERGTVTVTVTRAREDEADWLRFTVSDTGVGMTAEQQARLFAAFSQAEAGTQAKYGGTGLGLALSREFCRLMGGDISVRSTPGEGSSFTIKLPATAAARAEAPASAHP